MKTKNILLCVSSLFYIMSCNQIKEKIGGGSSENIISENTQLNCDYNNLSNQFNVKFVINKDPKKATTGVDYAVQILDKNNKVLKTIVSQPSISTDELDKYKICDQVKSLATKYNLAKNFDIESFDGNVVVGDFNFDGKDDFAVYNRKQDNKAYYNYYLQDASGEFKIDIFLSDDTDYFSKKYDVNGKTIVIQDKSAIKKYAYNNGSWTMKEEVNDPFPGSPEKGIISNFDRKSQVFISLYDSNFIKVGKVEFNTWENSVSTNNRFLNVNEIYNSNSRVSSLIYKSKNGLFLQLDVPGNYYINSLELKKNNFKPESFIDYFINHEMDISPNNIVMNIRQSSTANSTLIAQIEPNIGKYHVNFTGKKNGQWAEVSEVFLPDTDYDILETYTGWIKIISDNGYPNFNYEK